MAPDRFVGSVGERARQLSIDDPDLYTWLLALGQAATYEMQERARTTAAGQDGYEQAVLAHEPRTRPVGWPQ